MLLKGRVLLKFGNVLITYFYIFYAELIFTLKELNFKVFLYFKVVKYPVFARALSYSDITRWFIFTN